MAQPGARLGGEEGCSDESPPGDPEEDCVDLLDEAEALELVEFDPSVEPKESRTPPKVIESFLEKHFNRSLADGEREAIMKDFPKPLSGSLAVPKLDNQVKEHLKRKGKDPYFGAEKSLFKVQENLLDVAGPLSCLWLNKEAKISNEQVLLLTQRALVLLGSVSHQISQERRKIAWGNPKLKSLADEEYAKRETNLFGPGFLEMASKRLEIDKTMSKVSQPPQSQPPSSKRFKHDRSDLRNFLGRGLPLMLGRTGLNGAAA